MIRGVDQRPLRLCFRARSLFQGQISHAGSDLGQGEDELASLLFHVDLEGVLIGAVLDDVVVHVEQHPGRGATLCLRPNPISTP